MNRLASERFDYLEASHLRCLLAVANRRADDWRCQCTGLLVDKRRMERQYFWMGLYAFAVTAVLLWRW